MKRTEACIQKKDNPKRLETNRSWLTAVVANEKGEIFDLDGFAAVGADGPMHPSDHDQKPSPCPTAAN
jgi:hypothetical protein